MKRVIFAVLAVMLCVCLLSPAYAAENDFVPSISYKGAPAVVPLQKPDGGVAMGVIQNKDNVQTDFVDELCLVLTPVSEAKTSTLIPDSAEKVLLETYEKLTDGSMKIPYEKLGADINPNNMVIRDLFDASWLCSDHPVDVAKVGVTVKLVFDLGVADSAKVFCMTYKNNEWNPILSTKNLGDGKVECVFEDFCPIAFIVEQNTPPAQTGDTVGLQLPVWIAVMVVSAGCLFALVILKHKRQR